MGIARIVTIVSLLSVALFAAAAPSHGTGPSRYGPSGHRNVHVFDDYEDEDPPFIGAQKCHGTGFDTYVPGGEWVYQDCAPGTTCIEGFGAAKWHIWCIVPPTQ
jgi:hypothetical protein